MGIVAAAGQPLPLDWLISWIDAAYVCADGTVDSPSDLPNAWALNIPEIVQLFRAIFSGGAIRIG